MTKLRELLNRLRDEDQAATAVEYALIAGIIAVGAITVLYSLSDSIQGMFSEAADNISP